MEFLSGLGHHVFRRDSFRPTRADLLNPFADFLIPRSLDFRRGKALDAGEKVFGKFDAALSRPLQHLLRERFLCNRHG